MFQECALKVWQNMVCNLGVLVFGVSKPSQLLSYVLLGGQWC